MRRLPDIITGAFALVLLLAAAFVGGLPMDFEVIE
jgi:hypothetical protein